MPRQSTDQSRRSQEQQPLLSDQPTNETFSSFRDIGAADISASESLVSLASSQASQLTRLRAVGIIVSLAVLLFIQGTTPDPN